MTTEEKLLGQLIGKAMCNTRDVVQIKMPDNDSWRYITNATPNSAAYSIYSTNAVSASMIDHLREMFPNHTFRVVTV